jgi:dipeptidyl aminopeptidase/acylaminoacyl peptidase
MVKYTHGFGTFSDTYVLGLYDMSTGQLRLGFNYLGALLHTSWSNDSRAYSVVGPSPFGTDEAGTEFKSAAESGSVLYYMNRFQNVFTVDIRTGAVVIALRRAGGSPGNIKFMEDLPLSWKRKEGPMLVRADDNTFIWMGMETGRWKETGRFDVWKNQAFLSGLAADGRVLVGVAQTPMIPPSLFAYNLKSGQTELLTDLNPAYRSILLGRVEQIDWTNKYGSRCAGFVIKPVGYEAGRRYPMVFLAAPPSDDFISDAPYTTAFAPQPLAGAGFLVVIAQYPLDNKIPPGQFPGEMRDAYNWMGMVESAVDLLTDRGMVDQNNVGIAGFSRTSWLTDFTLTHSTYNLAAASSADGGIYTYGNYFMYNSSVHMRASETQVGGPPFGDTLRYWLEYAPPFNAEKVRAAVLMEYIDTAEYGFEFFTALSRLGKAVEFYHYPHGAHPLDTPFERIGSLQRNVDWFRFWMQGYEGKPPDYDPDQYVRWHELRKLQEQNEKKSANAASSTSN